MNQHGLKNGESLPHQFQSYVIPATITTVMVCARSSICTRQKNLQRLKTLAKNGRLSVVFKKPVVEKVKSEDMEQAEFVMWMRQIHPEHRIFAIPNGGWRSKATVMKLKATGVSPGVPDLFIPSLGLFIEMKRTKGGRVSTDQTDWLRYLRSIGYKAEVCYGKDEAINLVSKIIVDGL
jgi:hypothetical protein